MGEKKRVEEIDILRGLAAIMMILGHSIIVYPVDLTAIGWCRILKDWIYAWHMEMFFLLAGMVFHFSTFEKLLKSKAKRLLLPYTLFGIISIVFHMIGGSYINGEVSLKDGFYNFVFYGGNYWFLYTLFIMSVFFPLLIIFLDNKALVVIIVMLSVIISGLLNGVNVLTVDKIFWHLPFFIIGYIISFKVFDDGPAFFNPIIAIFCIIVFVGSMYYLHFYSDWFNIISFFRSLSILYVFLCISKVVHKKGRITNFIQDCGKYSLQLYLFNGYLLVVMRTIICRIINAQSPIVIILFIWIFDIVITMIACKIIERTKYIKYAFGL